MPNRTNLGKSLARRSAASRGRGGIVALVDALGLTVDDLYPVWELKLPGGAVVEQRGSDGADACRRYYQAHGVRAEEYRRKPAQP